MGDVIISVLWALACAAGFVLRLAWIRWEHRRMRGCPDHGSEADARAAVAATASARTAVAVAVLIPVLIVAAPGALTAGWLGFGYGMALSLGVGGVARFVNGHWAQRRRRELGLRGRVGSL